MAGFRTPKARKSAPSYDLTYFQVRADRSWIAYVHNQAGRQVRTREGFKTKKEASAWARGVVKNELKGRVGKVKSQAVP